MHARVPEQRTYAPASRWRIRGRSVQLRRHHYVYTANHERCRRPELHAPLHHRREWSGTERDGCAPCMESRILGSGAYIPGPTWQCFPEHQASAGFETDVLERVTEDCATYLNVVYLRTSLRSQRLYNSGLPKAFPFVTNV